MSAQPSIAIEYTEPELEDPNGMRLLALAVLAAAKHDYLSDHECDDIVAWVAGGDGALSGWCEAAGVDADYARRVWGREKAAGGTRERSHYRNIGPRGPRPRGIPIDIAILKEARKNAGLTLVALAAESGISRMSIIRYECGLRLPTASSCAALERVLGVSLTDR